MNAFRTILSFAALLSMTGLANAGLVFEKQPDVVPPLPDQSAPVKKKKLSEGMQKIGRNVDLSAKVAPMTKMNRQRIDLESRVTSRITQSGIAPEELQIIRGLGRQVTVEDALRQILPSGWEAYSDQDLPTNQLVDWDGNRSWPMALHTVLAAEDMRAHIDWENQELMLFVPAPKSETSVTVAASAAASAPESTPGATELSTPESPKQTVRVEVKDSVWSLTTEKTLRENLRTWATAAGWNLVWSATFGDTVVDYPVDAKVDFTGELVGVHGAMAKVIAAYSDADRPLEIEFFKGNRVIEVRLHRVPDARGGSSEPNVFVPARVPADAKQAAQASNSTP